MRRIEIYSNVLTEPSAQNESLPNKAAEFFTEERRKRSKHCRIEPFAETARHSILYVNKLRRGFDFVLVLMINRPFSCYSLFANDTTN